MALIFFILSMDRFVSSSRSGCFCCCGGCFFILYSIKEKHTQERRKKEREREKENERERQNKTII